MYCPKCLKGDTRVLDSRDDLGLVRRRRSCLGCHYRFNTLEKLEFPELTVIKKDGRREPFERSKILTGIERATKKRPIDAVQIEAMLGAIEERILKYATDQLSSKLIGEIVAEELKNRDEVAYLRFASVYHSFENLKHFEEEVARIKKHPGK